MRHGLTLYALLTKTQWMHKEFNNGYMDYRKP